MSDANYKSIKYLLEEIALRMCAMYTPPVVGKDVEDTQKDDQEGSRPLGFEADGNHDARGKTEKGDYYATHAPFSLKDESKEQEYE